MSITKETITQRYRGLQEQLDAKFAARIAQVDDNLTIHDAFAAPYFGNESAQDEYEVYVNKSRQLTHRSYREVLCRPAF